MEYKSNTLLKVTSILMIVGGVLGILVGLLYALGAGGLALVAGEGGAVAAILLTTVFTLLSMSLNVAAGIVGVVNANKPHKAKTCIVFGGIIIGLTVLGGLVNMSQGNGFDVLGLLVGLVLPGLYMAGAFQNKKLAEASSQPVVEVEPVVVEAVEVRPIQPLPPTEAPSEDDPV